MIFDQLPNDWKDLQKKVHQAFTEMGCHAEEPKTISLVRGNKEIDVYVEDTQHEIISIYLIECKYWESDIPQEIIHGFRTVISDSGANKGLIIAKKGFQSGAHTASEKTPLELLTWNELNTRYFEKWRAFTTQSIQQRARTLADFRSFPYGPMCDEEPSTPLTNEEHQQWLEYSEGVMELLVLAHRNIFEELLKGPVRILRPGVPINDHLELVWWNIRTPREWFDYISPELDKWITKVEEWRRQYALRVHAV